MNYTIVYKNEERGIIGIRSSSPSETIMVENKSYLLNVSIPHKFGYYECFYVLKKC